MLNENKGERKYKVVREIVRNIDRVSVPVIKLSKHPVRQ